MERIKYPFEPGNIGIPFETVFKNYAKGGNKGVIMSGSGIPLNYEVKKDSLYIEDPAFVDRFMYAKVEGGVAQFNLQTKTSPLDIVRREFPWPRHPDMFVKKFIGVALEHFKNNGIEVTICKAVWKPNSDDHTVYTHELAVDGDRVRAVKATQSAQIFASYGYSEINLGDIEHSNLFNKYIVHASFHRPT